jgi:3-methyladenine DNA glycosylase/8-oxoguanine DNA glycosylase
LYPFEWDDKFSKLIFALSVSGNSVDINVQQNDNKLRVSVLSKKKIDSIVRNKIRNQIARALSIDVDTRELLKIAKSIDAELYDLVRNGAGRLLRSPSLWEDAAKTLFTTNCSWSLTQKMSKQICSEEFVKASPSGRYPFPSPDSICKYSAGELKEKLSVGYRAEYLRLLANEFTQGEKLYAANLSELAYAEAYKIVRSLMGFGEYAANHLMVLEGFYNEIPVDTVVTSFIKKEYKARNIYAFIDRKYKCWGSYKWWGLKLDKIKRKVNWLGD